MSAAGHPTVREARRRVANMASYVRREVTGWVRDRNAAWHYEKAYETLVAVEDELGIDAAGPLGDRLRELRWEADRAGLLDPCDVGAAETRAIAAADAHTRSKTTRRAHACT